MRLFSLEYIRQILNFDGINFLVAKKKTQFKIKNQVGPFICTNREAGLEAEKYLQEFKFIEIFLWYYDPLGVISKLRVKCKITPYVHEKKPDIDKYSNRYEWLEKTLIEAEK